MTKIVFTSFFHRAFKKIISANPKLEEVIRQKFEVFQQNPFDPTLRNHKLSGELKAYRSFSITRDIRVIFRFTNEGEALFIDMGRHDDVY